MNNDVLLEKPDMIKNVQETQLEILKEFMRICQENELTYHVYAGTLLGAVRHKGFIPWDDDIDVAMLREDYNKFIKISKKELGHKYFLQTIDSDKNTQVLFAKLRKNNTEFVEKNVEHLDMHHGVFIDIFPLDNVKNEKYNIHYEITNFFYRIHKFIHRNNQQIDKNKLFIKKVLDRLIRDKSKIKLKKMVDKMFQKYNGKDTEYVNHLTNGVNKERYNRYLIKKEDFLDTTAFNFENIEVLGPKKYDEYLTQLYGDYMELPSAEDRIPHHGIVKLKL